MKKLQKILMVATAFMLAACAAEDAENSEEKLLQNDSPVVWIAEDDDSRLYMIGTVPLVPESSAWQTAEVMSALESAETFFFESDTRDSARAEALRLTAELGLYDGGDKLSSYLDDLQIKLLINAAADADVPRGTLENMKPWFAGEILSVAAAESAGLKVDIAPDTVIQEWAKLRVRKTEYLDDVDVRIRDMADLPQETQIEFLSNVMTNYGALGDSMKATALQWEKGKLSDLMRGQTNIYSQLPEADYEALLAKRNARWSKELTAFMEGSGSAIVVVGMPHLLGSDSLQYMLRENGYPVRRHRSKVAADTIEE
ncbi:MAG: TraB/GumN family protein [Hellea sp.]|nr:TraB/GumN family protein [Hellea sp.]